MAVALKLSVEQVAAAIKLLAPEEKMRLGRQLPHLLTVDESAVDGIEWTRLSESALDFWLDPAEDIYADMVPASSRNGG